MAEQPVKKRAFDTYECVINEIKELTPRNKGVKFFLENGKKINFKAGQFVQVFVPLPDGKIRRTSYSIASAPDHHDYFELCVTLVDGGTSSTFIHNLKSGDKVKIMGPLGRFAMTEDSSRDAVFICTGSGVAPFRSMIWDQIHKKSKKNLYLINGNRYDNDIIYQQEWEDLAKSHPNFKHLFTLSRPEKWTGEKGYVQEKIEGFIPDLKNKDYLICGLTNMINAVEEKLLSLGVPKEQIHFERYD